MSDTTIPLIDTVIPSGEPWMGVVRAGHLFRIVDLEGNQAADTLFYNADDPADRYSAQDTIRAQGGLYLTTGTRLVSTRGHTLLTITADTCGCYYPASSTCLQFTKAGVFGEQQLER